MAQSEEGRKIIFWEVKKLSEAPLSIKPLGSFGYSKMNHAQ